MKKMVFVSDGIAKDVTYIGGIKLYLFADGTISEIADRLKSGELSIENYNHVLFHVGTNDITSKASFDDIISDFGNRNGVVK